jgi:hypothetical protein
MMKKIIGIILIISSIIFIGLAIFCITFTAEEKAPIYVSDSSGREDIIWVDQTVRPFVVCGTPFFMSGFVIGAVGIYLMFNPELKRRHYYEYSIEVVPEKIQKTKKNKIKSIKKY